MKHYKVIGLMSGTSLDGVDIAYCEFEYDTKWNFEIIQAETIEYPSFWIDRLSTLMNSGAETLTEIDRSYGKYLGQITKDFIIQNRVSPDFISSHGHTIFHQPEKGFTLQIGDGSSISAITGLTVVYDFRSLDVALGGQGAPLVPIGDRLLFGAFDYCLNLGGIANISFEKTGKRLAFDICPVNMVLNYLSAHEGCKFDMNGAFASNGSVNPSLLQKLNHLDYYQKNTPKSLGKEWVDCHFLPLINGELDCNENKLRTVTEHIAMQIAAVINTLPKGKLLVTGGGAKNKFLVDVLETKLACDLVIPDNRIIDFKEALIFAFLGVLRWRNEINVLSSVTGAVRDCCSGSIVMV